MASSPISIILDMVVLLLENTITTFYSILTMFGDLLGSLFNISGSGGSIGIFLALIIFGVVGYFVTRYFFSSAKTVFFLLLIGIFILFFVFFGIGMAN